MRKVVPYLGALSVASYAVLMWLPLPFDLALFVLIIVAASTIWFAEPAPISSWPLPDGLVALVVLALLASIAFSSHLHRSLVLSSAFVPAGLLYLMITRYIRAPDQLVLVFSGFSLSALGISILIATRAFVAEDPTQRVQDAAIPILVVPNDVLFLSLIAPLSLSVFFVAESRLVKAAATLSLLATTVTVVVLESRIGLIALGLSVLIASLGFRIGVVLKSLITGLFSAIAVDALLGFPLLSKFSSLCHNRTALWAAAWELFLEKPFFGHGAHTFKDLYRSRLSDTVFLMCEAPDDRIAPWPHNLFLELLSSQGIFGATVFCATLAWAFSATYSATRSNRKSCNILAWGVLGTLGGFAIASVAELSLLRLWVVVLFAVLIGAALQLRNCADTSIDRTKLT